MNEMSRRSIDWKDSFEKKVLNEKIYSESKDLKHKHNKTYWTSLSLYVSPQETVEGIRENPSKIIDLSVHMFTEDAK